MKFTPKVVQARLDRIKDAKCNIPTDCEKAGLEAGGCCFSCAKQFGFFKKGEISQLIEFEFITAEEAAWIPTQWNKKTGYRGKNGCKLEKKSRRLMSTKCLTWGCF